MSKCALIGNVFGLRGSDEVSQGLEFVGGNSGSVHEARFNRTDSRRPYGASDSLLAAFPGLRPSLWLALHPGLLSVAPSGSSCRYAVSNSKALTRESEDAGAVREEVSQGLDRPRKRPEFEPCAKGSYAGAEAQSNFAGLAARLKSCPFTSREAEFSVFPGPQVRGTGGTRHAWWTFAFMLILTLFAVPAGAADAPRSFSLSTSRTFAPGESVKIQLLARNVPELEFRVYKIRDAQKFFAGLKDLHSFGVESRSPSEQIDQQTLLERLHDFKAHLWWLMRHFFRGQFTDEARDNFREQQGKLGKKSQVVGAAQFAQIPILNSSQLVARWKLETPPALVSETQQLPIDGLGAGVYLIEATDGTYKAYTVAMVTKIAMVERIENGQVALYVADRVTGAPVEKADVAVWTGGKMQSSGSTNGDGMAELATGSTAAQIHAGAEPENVWILARHGDDNALVTPWGYNFGQQNEQQGRAYFYTDRPVYRPGHTVHIKGILRKEAKDALDLPDERTGIVGVMGPDSKQVLTAAVTVSAHGTVTADLNLAADAALGYYSINYSGNGEEGDGSFYVEDYKKPEYQVKVNVPVARVLQGKQIQATIEAKYFFGEPVSGAKVTYVVHTSAHYWWDEDQGDDNGEADAGNDSDDASGDTSDADDADSGFGETEQQEHQGVLDADGRLTINLPTAVDEKREDQDYRIEARVTDAANREVSRAYDCAGDVWIVSRERGADELRFPGGQPARVKVTAQDYDGKPVQTQVQVRASLEKWDSVTHERSMTLKANVDATTGADGTAMVDLAMNGQTATLK